MELYKYYELFSEYGVTVIINNGRVEAYVAKEAND